MSTLWRAILEGAGWRLGKQAAEEAIKKVENELLGPEQPEAPKETPEAARKRLEKAAHEAEKAAAAAAKAKAARDAQMARDVDRELAALKKDVAKGKR